MLSLSGCAKLVLSLLLLLQQNELCSEKLETVYRGRGESYLVTHFVFIDVSGSGKINVPLLSFGYIPEKNNEFVTLNNENLDVW